MVFCHSEGHNSSQIVSGFTFARWRPRTISFNSIRQEAILDYDDDENFGMSQIFVRWCQCQMPSAPCFASTQSDQSTSVTIRGRHSPRRYRVSLTLDVCNYRWLVRLRGCISYRLPWVGQRYYSGIYQSLARRRWHLSLSSSVVTNYVSLSNILLSPVCHTNTIRSLFSITLLCAEIVQKLYRNRPPSSTEVVRA